MHHRGARLIAHLIFHRTRRRRELDRERDVARIETQVLDESETDDVAVEVWIADNLQRLEHSRLVNLHILKNIVHSAPVPEASPNRGVMIVLAYLWLLAVIPLLLEKQDSEVQWHAKHGIVLMIAELLGLFAYMLLTSVVSLATFGLGCILGLFLVFAWVAILALHVAAIIKGVNGGRLVIPGLSEYANRF